MRRRRSRKQEPYDQKEDGARPGRHLPLRKSLSRSVAQPQRVHPAMRIVSLPKGQRGT
jgi:hypothetical protein